MIKINLTPKEYLDKMERSILIAKVALAGFVLACIIFSLSVWQFTRATALEIELANKNLEYNSLKEDVKKAEEIKSQINEINNYISAIDKITKGRYLYVAFMQDLNNNLPETMWFAGVQTRGSGENLQVNINLNSNSLYDIAWWISFLEKNERTRDINVGNINVSEGAETNVYSLPLSFSYAYK
ncbi:MAG: hypothetical protein AB1637_03950 [Elusimicrobiota bacterium]